MLRVKVCLAQTAAAKAKLHSQRCDLEVCSSRLEFSKNSNVATTVPTPKLEKRWEEAESCVGMRALDGQGQGQEGKKQRRFGNILRKLITLYPKFKNTKRENHRKRLPEAVC